MNVTGNATTLAPLVTGSGGIDVNLFYAVFHPFLALVTVIGNLLTIIAFWKEPRLRERPSDLLIPSLAWIDLGTGLIVLPLQSPLYIVPGNWPIGEIGCKVLVVTSNFCLISSLLILIGISLDRFFLVSRDYPRYLKLQSGYRVHIYITFSFGISAATQVVELGLWDYVKKTNPIAAGIDYDRFCLSPARRNATFSLAFFFICFIVPVLIVGALSTGFLILLRRRLLKTRKVGAGEGSEEGVSHTAPSASAPTGESGASESSVKNRYIKPAITLIALVSAMGICMIPYCSYVIIVNFICNKCSNVKVLYGVLLLQYSNAVLDPIFYASTQSKIRKYYRAKIKNMCKV